MKPLRRTAGASAALALLLWSANPAKGGQEETRRADTSDRNCVALIVDGMMKSRSGAT